MNHKPIRFPRPVNGYNTCSTIQESSNMNDKITRRAFVKTTARAAGIATVTGVALNQMLAAGAYAAGDETITR